MTHRQRLTLLAAILGSGVAAIDGTIVNVALPAIEHDLGGGLTAQQWISNAYLLTLGSLILIGGSLGDIYGERRVFSIGVAAFGVFSVALRLRADDRGADRRAGAPGRRRRAADAERRSRSSSPPSPRTERGAAIGSWTAWGGIATIVGPLAGGWIVDQALVALDLRAQRAGRRRRRWCSSSRQCRRRRRSCGRRVDVRRRGAVRASGSAGIVVRADRAAALRLGRAP